MKLGWNLGEFRKQLVTSIEMEWNGTPLENICDTNYDSSWKRGDLIQMEDLGYNGDRAKMELWGN